MKYLLICTLAALNALAPLSSGSAAPYQNDYFGLTPPGTIPQEFPFSSVVSSDYEVGNPVFSPDGSEFYFTDSKSMHIHKMHHTGDGWSTPVKASFSNEGRNWEPFITKDNKTLYFVSTRAPGNAPHNGRIWASKRLQNGSWGAPSLVIDRQTNGGFWFPNSPTPGILYFGATLEDSFGEGDFYKASHREGTWHIEHLPAPFNTPDFEWDPYISPDGTYMIFESKRPEGLGGTDIYVSFKEGDTWGAPRNLGVPINSAAYETAANITPDGAYMFYTLVPNKGKPRIYWVSTDAITRLKTKN